MGKKNLKIYEELNLIRKPTKFNKSDKQYMLLEIQITDGNNDSLTEPKEISSNFEGNWTRKTNEIKKNCRQNLAESNIEP